MSTELQQKPHDLGAIELLKETISTTAQLAEKQIALLRAEMTTVIDEERKRLILICVGVATSVAGLSVLLVAAALGLGTLAGHAALWTLGMGILVSAGGGTLLSVGLRNIVNPLENTRHIVEEEIRWAKDKLGATTTSASSNATSNDSGVAASR